MKQTARSLNNLLLGLTLLITNTVMAQTTITAGTITANTTWTKAASPYIITNNLMVTSGVTLTLEPGATLKFNSNVGLIISGELIANGNASDSIYFIANNVNENWAGITFTSGAVSTTFDVNDNYLSGSIFKFAAIRNVISQNGALYTVNTGLLIDRSSIDKNTANGLRFNYDGAFTTKIIVSNSYIGFNNQHGIQYDGYQLGGTFKVIGNTIKNNGQYGIQTNDGVVSQTYLFQGNNVLNNGGIGIAGNCNGTQTIENNLVYNNGNGIYSRGSGTYTIRGNRIIGNIGYGLNPRYATHIIEKNVIAGNNGAILFDESGSFTVNKNSVVANNYFIDIPTSYNAPIDIKYNLVARHVSGLKSLITTFQPSQGQPFFKVNNNKIAYNSNANWIRNVRLVTSNSIAAENNYWNETNETVVKNYIYDYEDDNTKSLVNITPVTSTIDTSVALFPVRNVKKSVVGSDVVLTWTISPESDVAGYKIYYGGYTGYSYSNVINVIGSSTATYTLPSSVSIGEDIAVTAYDGNATGTDDQVNGYESWYSSANSLPLPPSALVADSSARRVKLSWTSSTSNGVNAYYIYRSTDNSSFAYAGKSSTTSFVDSNLTAYTRYYYKVTAFDSLDLSYDNFGLESIASNTVTATPNRIVYVSNNGNNSNIGSFASPKQTIVHSIDFIASGDSIILFRGQYNEIVDLKGKVALLSSRFVQTGDTADISATIISGVNNGNPMLIQNTATAYTSSMHIYGLTLQDARIFVADLSAGNYSFTYKMSRSIIRNSGQPGTWGVITVGNGGVFDSCVVYGLKGRYILSTGLYNAPSPIVSRSIFYDNSISNTPASSYSGENSVIFVGGTNKARVLGNLIYRNKTSGIHIGGNGTDSMILVNNTVVLNEGYGIRFQTFGGVYTGILINNILAYNKELNLSCNIVTNGPSVYVKNNFLGNTASLAQTGLISPNNTILDTTGNIGGNPYFVDTTANNFRLLAWSPSISAGVNTNYLTTKDLDGSVRINPYRAVPDLGAYESTFKFRAPVFLKTEPGHKKVALFWNQSPTTGITGYNIYRSTSSISDTSTIAYLGQVNSSSTMSFIDSSNSLVNGTTYYYRIKSVDGNNSLSGFSNQITAIPDSVTSPEQLVLHNSPSRSRLSWAGVGNKYQIFRGTNTQNRSLIADSVIGLTYNDTSFLRNTYYQYWIKAMNSTGALSEFSQSIQLTPTNTWYVDSAAGSDQTGIGSLSLPYKKITKAVQNVIAADSVLVRPGTYQESLVLEKQISLVSSSGPDSTRISQEPLSTEVVKISDPDFNNTLNLPKYLLRGFTIVRNPQQQAQSTAIRVERGASAILKNLVIDSFHFALSTYYGYYEMFNSVLHNNENVIGNDVASANRPNTIVNTTIVNTRSNITMSNSVVVNKFYNTAILNRPNLNFSSSPFTGPKVHFYNTIIDSRLQTYVPETGSIYSYLTNADSAGFVNLAQKNFRLTNMSQLIGKGGITISNNEDFSGGNRPLPAGSLPDVGAFESAFALSAPTFSLVEPGNRHSILYWKQIPTTDITAYKVYRSLSPISDTSTLVEHTTIAGPHNTQFTDSVGVQNGVVYYYRLKSVRSDGLLSGFSLQKSAKPDSVTIPQGFTLDNSPRYARLTWNAIALTNSRYQVYRSLDSISKTLIADTINAITYIDSSFNRNTTYYYFVRAINETGALSLYSPGLRLTPTNSWLVDSSLGNNNTGIGSQLAPFKTITVAVGRTVTNDTIQVKKGTYIENININNKVLTLLSISGSSQTILRPLQATSILRFNNAGNSYVKGFTFANGSAQVAGSAIAETNSNPTITNCIFRNNGAAGGVIITYGGSFKLYNSIAYSNSPNTFFELSNQVTSIPKIYHFTYVNNSGNFYNAGNSGNTVPIPEFRNCIIWQASTPLISGVVSIENSIIKGGFSGSTSNLDVSPSFVDSVNNNFQLQNSSRAIGIGLNNLGVTRDFNDSLRPNPAGSSPDLGAFESVYDHPSPIIVSDSSRNGIVSFNWTQTPLSTVNKFYVYKDTVSSSRNLYDSTSLFYTYSDTSNIIFNKVLFYNITSKGIGLFESGFSNQIRTISFTPPSLLFPADSAIGVDTVVTLRWNRIPNATRYSIQLSTDSTFSTGNQQFIATDTFYTRSGLPGNTMYYWRVQTRDSVNYSKWSERKKFETFVLPPRLISVRPGNRIDTLTWNNPNSSNIAFFKIYRSLDSTSRIILDTIPGSELTYIDTLGLQLDSTYYYWVTAVNLVGTESAFSNRLSGRPYNKKPVTVALANKSFSNVGEYNFVRCVYSMVGSADPDGQIVNHLWYVNDSLVSVGDTTLIYYYGRGTNTLKLITIDNDGASDTSVATIVLKTFTKQFTGGILGGISAVSPNIIYTADSTYSPITGASVFKLDRLGNTTYPLIVSSKIFTTPSVSSDSSVFITSGSSLNGFNKAGVSLWPTIPLGGLSYVTPTIDSMYKRIYVGVSNSNFLAVNYQTGTVAWSVFCDAPINISAVITGDRKLVFVSQSGRLYGFRIVSDSAQTAPRWSQDLGEIISKSPAVDLNNDLYFGTQSGKLLKLRLLANGSVQTLWSVSLGSSVESSPVIDARGYVYAGTNDGKLFKVNPETGQIMWNRQASGAIKSTPAVTDFGNIVFATMSGSIMAVDSVNNLKWTHKETDPISANLLYIDNIIYAGTQSGAFIGLYDNPSSNTVNPSLSLNRPLRITRERQSSMCNLDGVPIKYVNAYEHLTPAPEAISAGDPEQPIWGTFQGNFRRTGSRTLDCPERPTINLAGSQSICAGDSIRLATSSNSNSVWIFNNSNLNIADTVLFAKQAGTYKRMNTNDNGCKTYSDSFVLVVNPLPVKPTVAVNGAQTFCEGASSQISSSATNNSWYRVGSNSLLSAAQTYNVSQSGQYYVRTINSLGCSVNSDTISFTVFPRPATPSVTTNRMSFCTGDSAVLSTNSVLQKQWLNSGIPISNASGSTYTVRTAGFYSLTVTDANGCTNNSANLQIVVNPLPSIAVATSPSNGAVCVGSSITLTATGASTYSWSGGVTNGVAFTPSQSGNYLVTATDVNGCVGTAVRSIIVNPLPNLVINSTPTTSAVCIGGQVVLTATGASTYSWSGGVTNGVAFTPSQSGSYTVTGTDINGCVNTAIRSVVVNPLPVVNINTVPANGRVCIGSPITLTATGASTYSWSGGVTNGVAFTPSQSGNYLVTAIDVNGCQNTTSQSVVVNSLPTISVVSTPSNATVCSGSPITLTASGASTYSWSGGITNGTSFNPTQSGTYVVIGTDINGCRNQAERVINVNPLPIITIQSDPINGSVCAGSPVTLVASGANTYSWNGGITNGSSFIPTQSTSYSVTGTDANNCRNTATATITVLSLPVVQISNPANNFICDGSSTVLNAVGNGTFYQWYINNAEMPGQNNSSINALVDGSYTVITRNIQGCRSLPSTPVVLQLYRSPQVSFTFDTYCVDVPVQFNNSSITTNSGPVQWEWNFGTGVTSTSLSPTYTYLVPGSYMVSLKAIPTRCPSLSRTELRNITIDKPQSSIRYPAIKAIQNTPTSLAARAIGTTYQWLPSAGLSSSIVANPIFNSSSPQDYLIRIRSSSGCLTTDTLSVYVFKESGIYVPKAFSPNGDGQNERLYPELVNFATLQYFRVYNRWGQLVYESRSMNSLGWDGVFNGVKQPMDTYTWFAAGTDKNGKLVTGNGQTLLIR